MSKDTKSLSPVEQLLTGAITADGIPFEKHPLCDFRKFLWLTWRHLNLPQPTKVQLDIAHYLQHGPKRSIIQAFRGVGKSWVTSAFVCWLLLMNPQLNILVVSASKVRADDFTTFTMRLISEMDILAGLVPQEGQRNSKIAFDVGPARASHAPSVKSVGITGQLAGSRADVIIPDDVEIPNNSATQAMRDKLSESVKEFDAILKPGGVIRYLGTPQTEMSLYNALADRGYETRIWPARYPTEKQREGYGNKLAPLIVSEMDDKGASEGHPTDPARFSLFDLSERELSYGRTGFALQFMLDTSLSDANLYPLKVSDLVITPVHDKLAPENVIHATDVLHKLDDLTNVAFTGDHFHSPFKLVGEFIPYQGAVMSIDPSGRGSDETGYAVLKMLNGVLWCPAAGGMQGGYSEEALTSLALIAIRNRVNQIVIESNFGDGMFTQLFKPVLKRECEKAGLDGSIGIEEVRHSQQKERRIIDTLEPILNQHRLVIDRKVIEQDYQSAVEAYTADQAIKMTLVYQLTRITRQRGALAHDDRIDALAIAATYWVEQMALDVNDSIRSHRETLIEKEVERLLDAIAEGADTFAMGWSPKDALDEGEDGWGRL